MAGLQDLPVRLAELLDLSPAESLALASKVIPIIVLESIVDLPTTRVSGLVGAPSIGSAAQTATAAQFSHTQIFNPLESGVDLFVDRAIFSFSGASVAHIARLDAGLTTEVTTKEFRDFRRRGNPVGQVRHQANAAFQGTIFASVDVSTDQPHEFPFDSVILGEGHGLVIAPGVLNLTARTIWLWREVT